MLGHFAASAHASGGLTLRCATGVRRELDGRFPCPRSKGKPGDGSGPPAPRGKVSAWRKGRPSSRLLQFVTVTFWAIVKPPNDASVDGFRSAVRCQWIECWVDGSAEWVAWRASRLGPGRSAAVDWLRTQQAKLSGQAWHVVAACGPAAHTRALMRQTARVLSPDEARSGLCR